ncbi:hypothetical protein O0L34_g966 [Tuta absoluta]|nr:hypothetical protein O0L34_g966 [Tuta absoluta]
MSEEDLQKLWVIKLCLKVIYPKYNVFAFLVFLAIKYRLYHKKRLSRKDMDKFVVKTAPQHVLKLIAEECLEGKLSVILHKCIIISKEQYIQLCAENLFYIDNGVLWVCMKVSQEIKRKYKHKINNKSKENNLLHFRYEFLPAEIKKKISGEKQLYSIDNIRVVPIVGSKLAPENIAYTNENEFKNILTAYGFQDTKDAIITFHPVPSIEKAPKIASRAEVSLIVNDYDLANDFVKEVLNNYFEEPKLLAINDVFSIDLIPSITSKYHYKYLDLVEAAGKLYFKCNDVASEEETKASEEKRDRILQPFFIVRNITKLTLGENMHAIKPKDEFYNPQDYVKDLNFLNLCPTGLRQKFDQMQETVAPFLTGDINDLSSVMTTPIIPMLLLTGNTGSGRHLLVKTLAKYNGMNCLQIDCNGLQSTTAKQTESKISSMVQKAKGAAPVIVLLDNFEVFAVDPENNEDCRVMEYFMNTITDLYQNYTRHPIIFVAVTERVDLKPNILRMFLEKFHLSKPNIEQRYDMLQWFASAMHLNVDNDKNVDSFSILDQNKSDNLSVNAKDVLHRVAAKTETFMYGGLDALLHFALRDSYLKQHSEFNQPPTDPNLHLVQEEDFNSALESIRSLQSQHLDAPKIPKVYWEDIGGLEKLKKELLKTIEFPIKYPHLFKNSTLKRSGILLYGPPGCGKTLVAKAVSTELNVSFLSVKGPELLNMYIGQSEENVRKVFEAARASSPCIVFLDELDALAPRRGAAGDSGGASDRVVSQLLAEVDGVASGEDADSSSFVFIMGATNRPDLLEQSLLRPGRLDKLIYVGPYSGMQEKSSVLRALCRSYKLRPEVDLEQVSAALPERCTGADLLHVVSTARSAAVRTLVHKLHSGVVKESELSQDSVVLGVSEFYQGVETFRPSVTDEELAYYESLQSQM